MKIIMQTWHALLPSFAALAVSATLGCSEGTTRKDVASARDKLQKEQQQTADTIHEGQQDVADAQPDGSGPYSRETGDARPTNR